MTDEKIIEKRCYVCGLELDEYPYDPVYLTPNGSVICPCCGIHYGYDDDGAGEIIPDELAYSGWKFGDETHKKIIKYWRQYWMDKGMKWWSVDDVFNPIPKDWDPKRQLENIPETFK